MIISSASTADTAVITLIGRFDAHEIPVVRPHLRDILRHAPAGSTIDLNLAGVDFFDSRALTELINAHATARQSGAAVTVSTPSTPVRLMLALTHGTHDWPLSDFAFAPADDATR